MKYVVIYHKALYIIVLILDNLEEWTLMLNTEGWLTSSTKMGLRLPNLKILMMAFSSILFLKLTFTKIRRFASTVSYMRKSTFRAVLKMLFGLRFPHKVALTKGFLK